MPLSAVATADDRRSTIEIQAGPCLRFLSLHELPLWDALVQSSPQGNVFCRSWWLRTLIGHVHVLAYFKGDHLAAGIPLYFVRRLGIEICTLPKLVHTWGVVMEPVEAKKATSLSREMEILKVFGKRLSQQRIFLQSFHPSLSNWLPFYWNGFEQTTRFSYVLEDLSNVGRLWDEMDGNVRKNIRKAERSGLRIIPCGSDVVVATARKTFKNQRKEMPYSEAYLSSLYTAAQENRAGACFAAVDRKGKTHAAIFVAWDAKRAYYVAGGTDPDLRASGADSMLIWHALQFCADRTEAFDFSGSVVEGIEKFFRGFGGKLVPYNRIIKLPFGARACETLAARTYRALLGAQ